MIVQATLFRCYRQLSVSKYCMTFSMFSKYQNLLFSAILRFLPLILLCHVILTAPLKMLSSTSHLKWSFKRRNLSSLWHLSGFVCLSSLLCLQPYRWMALRRSLSSVTAEFLDLLIFKSVFSGFNYDFNSLKQVPVYEVNEDRDHSYLISVCGPLLNSSCRNYSGDSISLYATNLRE